MQSVECLPQHKRVIKHALLGIALVCWAPLLIFGSNILSTLALMFAIFYSMPRMIYFAFKRKFGFVKSEALVSAVLIFGFISTIILANYLDSKIPVKSQELVDLVIDYNATNGEYPESHESLGIDMPSVRYSAIQPSISYKKTEDGFEIFIPSTAGDAFSRHHFESKDMAWKHYH